ncbi:helical backbone metal receptor [Amycolatopsis regifaucium]|uniref:Cobalamin-binding protein n=1 Tax=Amycolatopsis regifaucium TaxID=546365 RepID=A0A154ME32_9PSEU|nr:helical backbone metal receptor [Amycolatopsis regifaucium]KZB82473.1 cobalamin-binding protein [Amycolatopsis regifaucium]OKA03407.1 cobalamin-binding protein [Amycolatopsis regifaucium]SFJ42856.1 ABC-type Fe3+-hydroxamate transport system, substrate-binding protein [Amycolatopsis regifaucium]
MIDDLGEVVPLREPASRVVSLVPSLTEAVEVSAPGRLAGATDYCTHPVDLDVPRVGGSKYPNVDEVLELEPDLVLANSEENRPEDVERLRANGIPVWVMEASATVPAALGSIRRLLTQAYDLAEPDWLVEAEEVWRETRPERFRAVVPVWRKPWIVLGRDTFGGDVLRRVGIGNVYADDEERYPRPKLEALQRRFADGDANLLVLPDEPYEFTADDGPETFPGTKYVLVSGRHLTWYGPSLVEAHAHLTRLVL